MGQTQPKKLNWWYSAIVDWMLENPHLHLKECARELSVTQPWLSTVINSDLFIAYQAERLANHSQAVSTTLTDRIKGLATMSLDTLMERIEEDEISTGQLKETSEMALKALGFVPSHGKAAAAPNIQIGVSVGVDRSALAHARARMRVVDAEAGAAAVTAQPPDADSAPMEGLLIEAKLEEVPSAEEV